MGLIAGAASQGTLADPRVLAEARALAADGAEQPRTITLAAGAADLLLEPIAPPPHLFLMGRGTDVVPLVGLAAALGWTTTVWDPRARFDTQARFAAADHICSGPAATVTAAVDAAAQPVAMVMGHDLDRDREALAALLQTRARYIGVLGPRHRTERLTAELGGQYRLDARLHAPAGLSIGAETPAEIALSVIGEIQTVLAAETIGHLKDRPGGIHRRPPSLLRAVGEPC
jgi:xanthine/CO dehydrogenase XdhC/CoxF family maturation factor